MVKPGAKPASFGDTTVHLPGAGPLPVSGPRESSSSVEGLRQDAVGEPARIRHLVNRVDVARAHVGCRSRLDGRRDSSRDRSSGRSPTPLTPAASCVSGSRDQRIVVEEAHARAGRRARRGQEQAAESESPISRVDMAMIRMPRSPRTRCWSLRARLRTRSAAVSRRGRESVRRRRSC